jgi:hypothetical protein
LSENWLPLFIFMKLELSGQKFGRLSVISFSGKNNSGHNMWLCKCDCGNEKIVDVAHLKSGAISSCGCLRLERVKDRLTVHGKRHSTEYNSWANMIQRCTNPNRPDYKYYGGRGIKVCERWTVSFKNFLEDMGLKPTPKHEIDRFPNNETGQYEPGNCRWATDPNQSKNRRDNRMVEYKGEEMILSDLARILLVRPNYLSYHLKRKTVSEIIEYLKEK